MNFEQWCYEEAAVNLNYEKLYKLAQDIYKENSLSQEEMQRLLEKLLDQKEIQDKLENMKQYKEEMEKLRQEYKEALRRLNESRKKLQDVDVQTKERSDQEGEEGPTQEDVQKMLENFLKEIRERQEAAEDQELRALTEEIKNWEANYRKRMSEMERKFRKEAKEKLLGDLTRKLLDKGIVWMDDRGKYEVSKVKVTEILARRAFEEIMKLIEGMGEKRGTHKSKKFGDRMEALDRIRKARRLSHRIALLPTLKNSLVRRTRDGGGPLLDEEDLVEFSHFREVPYSVVFAIDTSGSMAFAGKIEGAREAALSFAHYIRRRYKKDRVQFVEFNERIKQVCFEDLPNLGAFLSYGYRPFTHTGDCLKFVMDLFKEEKRDYEKLLYLITDGLPQRSYGNDEEYRAFTLKQAKLLRSQGIHFVEIFLNTKLTVKDLMSQFWHSSYLWSTPFASYPPDYILRFLEKKMSQDLKLFEYWGRKTAEAAQGLFFRIEDPKKLGTFFIEDYTKRKSQGLAVRRARA